MNGSLLFWIRFCMLSLCCLSASAVWGQGRQERPDRLTSLTHLNVTSRQIVYLRTNCVHNTAPENQNQRFFYDGGNVAFTTVPQGFSFVVTDIIIDASVCSTSLDRFFITVEFGRGGGLGRRFVAAFTGEIIHHYALAGGLVVSEGGTLTASNAVFSSGGAFVQVLGYFVRGPGLQEFHPFPFPEDEKSDN
jgi:hypothetical protein